MRNSLILQNIREADNETWDDTKRLVATALTELLGLNQKEVINGIERAHRGGKKDKNRNRNIFVRLYCSEDVKYYCYEIRKLNINGKTKIIATQQFSKKLTLRRDLALQERKRLKDSGDIIAGYLQFPATLMVKKEGELKFTVHSQF